MLLVDPQKAAKAIAAACGIGREASGTGDLAQPLDMIRPRVEGAMDVKTLAYGQFLDTFRTGGRGYDGLYALRLENGFIDVAAPLVVTNLTTGTPVDPADVDTDAERGIVYVPTKYNLGTLSVNYFSGFKAVATTDANGDAIPEPLQVMDTPMWLQTIAIGALNEWFRSIPLTPKVNDKLSLSALNGQANKYVQMQVWGRYMRPRAEVIWAYKSEVIDNAVV